MPITIDDRKRRNRMPWNGPFGYADGFTEALDRMMVIAVRR